MKIFIPGVGGFIGNWLVRRILETTSWEVIGLDLSDAYLTDPKDACLPHDRFTFHKADMIKNPELVEACVKASDVVVPLAAIANPAIYVKDPLKVFRLDFEANLAIIKLCVQHKKRVVFPSTSEVYGMCPDAIFDEETSCLVLGPTQKTRWIYSCSKQMLDRVIHAYGDHEGLSYTLFRPFNWMGPRLDAIHTTQEGQSRAITQLMSNAIGGRPLKVVDGGAQRRAFVYVDDAISALMKILENKNNVAHNKVFNIGNPDNDFSILEIAEKILALTRTYPKNVQKADASFIEPMTSSEYFGDAYQDVSRRLPSIRRAQELLGWTPTTSLEEGLKKTLDFYLS